MNKRHRMVMVVGSLLIFIGILCNEWLLISCFSKDGVIDAKDRIIIWVFDITFIGLGLYFIRYKRKIAAKINKQLLLVFVSILFSALLFISLDIYLGYRYLIRANELTFIKDIFIPDIRLGWKPKPNSIGLHRSNGNFNVRYRMDENGFKYVPNRGNPKFSIYFFGDSFTFGHGVENQDTFPNIILNKYLQNGVHVLNAGVSGYGIVQMFQRFLDIQHMIQKDDIIIFTPISTAIRRNIKDYVFVGQFVFLKQEMKVEYFPYYKNGKISYLKIDNLYNKLKTLLLYGRFTGRYFQLIYRKFPRPDTKDESIEISRTVKSMTEKKGAQFVLIFLPLPYECLIRSYYEDISSFPYFDIMHFFPSQQQELKKIVFNTDDHWNRAGHEIAAKAIITTLVEKGLLNKRYCRACPFH